MGKTQASTSAQGGAVLGGSGATSHVYIQYPPLRCDIPGAAGVMYDDGNKLLLVPAPSKVYSWPANQHPPPETPGVTNIKEGPILGVRFSLDCKILAVQRTNREIEFINRENGTGFSQQCKSGTDRIFGFFWTDCPSCDIVFVTTSGLELYALHQGRNSLKFLDIKKANVSWYVYTHESRLVLLASGMQCKTLAGYQFAAGGIIRLPKYDVMMAKADANRKPVLAPEDIRIATMYGRLYCLQVDRVALCIHMYRFYRDAVVPQGSLPIYSPHVAISVVDNVLLIHQTDSKVVLLYDILSDTKVPTSAPLPLLLRGGPLSSDSSIRSTEKDKKRVLMNREATIYGDGWVFVNPDFVLDHLHGLLWRLRLDLEAVAASTSNLPVLLAFLQRRRHEAAKAKELSLMVMRSMILERRPLTVIGTAMDVLTSSYAQGARPPNGTGGSSFQPTQFTKPLASTIAGITLSAGPRAGGPSSLTATPGVQSAVVMSSSGAASLRLPQDTEDSGDSEDDQVQASAPLRPEQGLATEDVLECTLDQGIMGSPEIEEESPTSVSHDLSSESSGRLNSSSMEPSVSSSPSLSGLQGIRMGIAAPLISPEEMQRRVFMSVEEETVVDTIFLVSVIVEYMRSAAREHVRVPPGLQAFVVKLLARDERFNELHQFIAGKLVEPSRAVALQLVEVGTHHTPTRKLGMEMLRLLHAHSDYVKLLLQDGRMLEGLRYIRRNKVDSVPPVMFLQAAASVNDAQKLAAVFRFCLDFIPGFQQTPDFITYSSRLNQQCTVGDGDTW
ncbi:unnamed protein product [Sphagnum troendelagicum]